MKNNFHPDFKKGDEVVFLSELNLVNLHEHTMKVVSFTIDAKGVEYKLKLNDNKRITFAMQGQLVKYQKKLDFQ